MWRNCVDVALTPYRTITEPSFGIHDNTKEQHPPLQFVEVLDAAYAGPARPRGRGETIWPGLLRRLDRLDPSYKN